MADDTPPSTAASLPREVVAPHTRLLRCSLEIDASRAYWAHATPGATAADAFDAYWFGSRSLPMVRELLRNMHARFDAFPAGLAVLARWRHMPPDTRALVCHWHLMLSDPLYRAFAGELLVARRALGHDALHRDRVVAWVADHGPPGWTTVTRIQCASKLLSCAVSAGLVAGRRDPRALRVPSVPDEALGYLLHLLRGVHIDGTLWQNAYLRSVGLDGDRLEHRLRALPGLRYQRQGALVDARFDHADLRAWADATVLRDRAA